MQERWASNGGQQPRIAPVPSGAGGTWRVRTNVLPRLTSFIGRTREVTALSDRLAEARLLTLTGVGGVGKSRLAIEVARAGFDQRFSEAWLVELAALSDPADVAGVVASVLGVHDGGRSALLTALADRHLLLVLDNCEHLAEAVGDLALDLLGSAPALHVLATSRVPLNVHGEATWRVDPLPVPDLDRLPGRMAVSRIPVVRLFVERARAARADFALTEQNLADVARICAGLDGLPLAIELAAAHVALLSPRQIADRLVDRFSLLAGGGRGAAPRQQTLRAALDWSYALLTKDEQAVFRLLGVFTGGFTLDAVEGLRFHDSRRAEGSANSTPDTRYPTPLEMLAGLVTKSLVVAEERHGGVRFRQLETVRQYGLERLQEAGELEEARRMHRDWFLAQAETYEQRALGAEQAAAFDWFELEMDNLRAAMDWCEADGAGALGLRLGAALCIFWHARGRLSEGRDRLKRLIALAGSDADTRSRARTVWMSSLLSFWAGDAVASEAGWHESRRLARDVGDWHLYACALGFLALTEQLNGHAAAADEMLAAALDDQTVSSLPLARATLLYHRGYLAVHRGDLALGEVLLEEAVTIDRAAGNLFGLAHCTGTLGNAALLRGDLERARHYLIEALCARVELKSAPTLAFTVEKLGWLAAKAGDAMRAARLLGAAANIRTRAGSTLYPYEMPGHQEAEAAGIAALGDGPYQTAYAEGFALTIDQAIELCREHDRQRTTKNGRVSRRTKQIAGLVARGLTNRQIADELVIQESTVANHLRYIYNRYDLAGRAQLAAWASKNGLTGDDQS